MALKALGSAQSDDRNALLYIEIYRQLFCSRLSTLKYARKARTVDGWTQTSPAEYLHLSVTVRNRSPELTGLSREMDEFVRSTDDH